MENILIKDLQNDTILHAKSILTNIGAFDWDKKFMRINLVQLETPRVKIHRTLDGGYNYNFIEDYFSSSDTTTSEGPKFEVSQDTVSIINGWVNYSDFRKDSLDRFGMDYDYLEFKNIHLKASGIRTSGDSLIVKIHRLSTIERSGFQVSDFNTIANIGPEWMSFKDLNFNSNNSEIHTNFLLFSYPNFEAFQDEFIEKVKIQSSFKHSFLYMGDIQYFAKELIGSEHLLVFDGDIKGKISNLKGKNMHIQTLNNTKLEGNISINGLPNLDECFINVKLKKFFSNHQDLAQLQIPPFDQQQYLELPENFENLGNFKIEGSFTGFLNSFVAFATLTSSVGKIKGDIKIDTGDDFSVLYDGSIEAKGFHLGRMYEINDVGQIYGKLNLKGRGLNLSDVETKISGDIYSLNLLDYNYNNIKLNGHLAADFFEGNVSLVDNNLGLDFNGKLDYRKAIPKYDFDASIKNADLKALNLVDLGKDYRVSSEVIIRSSGNTLDNINGEITLNNFVLSDGSINHQLGDIYISSKHLSNSKRFRFISDIITVEIDGNYRMDHLPFDLERTASSFFPSLETGTQFPFSNYQDFTYQIDIKKPSSILSIVEPTIKISEGAVIAGSYNSTKNSLLLDSKFGTIQYYDQSIESLHLKAFNEQDKYQIDLGANRLALNDSLSIDNIDLNFIAADDSLITSLIWDNQDSITYGSLKSLTYLFSPEHYEFKIFPSEINIADFKWKTTSGYIKREENCVVVDTFTAYNDKKAKLTMNGLISSNKNDIIRLDLEQFNLSEFNKFFPSYIPQLNGILEGEVALAMTPKLPQLIANIGIKDLSIGSDTLGNLTINSKLESDESVHSNVSLFANGFPEIQIDGRYFYNKKENNLDYNVLFHRKDLHFLNSIIPSDEISNLEGLLDGTVSIRGNLKHPLLEGKLNFSNGKIRINELNTSYSFMGKVDVFEDYIAMDYFPIQDEDGNDAFCNGTLLHTNFSDLSYDFFVLDMKRFLVMNTTYEDNQLYYGKGYISGTVGITGENGLNEISLNAKTEKGTEIVLPLYSGEDVVVKDFIYFVKDTNQLLSKREDINLSGLTLNLNLDVTPDAKVELVFDPKIGDKISGRGEGNLTMEVNQFEEFRMFGNIDIQEAEYLFTLYNTINKKFEVEKGGSISWFGDPYEAILNLNAIYKVQTSLYDLMGANDEKYKKKSQVLCYLNLKDELFNPQIAFDIDIPKADQDVTTVLSYLSANEDEMNKQIFALLLINRFLPYAGSNISAINHSNAIGKTTSAELLNNQVSNWLSQISDEVDIGLNYKPGDKITNNEIAIAVSTHFFQDRLSLSGNIGVQSGTTTDNSNNNFIGDFNIEYKIKEDGTVRVRGFNETNSNNLTNIDNVQYTQGVGIYYQEDFNSIKETKIHKTIKRIFKRKKKKEDSTKETSPSTGNSTTETN